VEHILPYCVIRAELDQTPRSTAVSPPGLSVIFGTLKQRPQRISHAHALALHAHSTLKNTGNTYLAATPGQNVAHQFPQLNVVNSSTAKCMPLTGTGPSTGLGDLAGLIDQYLNNFPPMAPSSTQIPPTYQTMVPASQTQAHDPTTALHNPMAGHSNQEGVPPWRPWP
jgi:hypothetical protein